MRNATNASSKSDHGLDVQAWQLKHSANRIAGGADVVPQNAETYRALYPYEPQNADELQLMENDIVFVVEKCDDGWYIGTSLRSGQFGTFPGNYVQRH
uniref:SH3 domain-containing protein n=1 Tax=Plectus sambesii TaxID=2011161 RepID=A0A914UWV8_9BILA